MIHRTDRTIMVPLHFISWQTSIEAVSILMNHLYAGVNDLTTDVAVGDNKLIRYIDDIMRYYLGEETEMSHISKFHGAVHVCYIVSTRSQEFITTTPLQIMGTH